MGDPRCDDWLPEGWTVKVKVRSNGKKDKFYFPPSGEGKFNSKIEVSRYLINNPPKCKEEQEGKFNSTPEEKSNSTPEVSCYLKDSSPKSEEDGKSNNLQSSRRVVVEKTAAEGLPPGWTKEIKVTKKGHKIRKDPFYTDPVSGYIFRSFKDALRYLESGEVGRYAFKPKEKCDKDVELEDDKTSSPAVADKQMLVLDGTSPVMSEHSSNLCESAMDEQIRNSSCTGGTDVFEHSSKQCMVGIELSSSGFTEDKGSDQTEGKNDSTKNAPVAVNAVGVPDKQSLEGGLVKDGDGSSVVRKTKKRKDLNLPRRSSKRLAGLPLDPTPELQTRKRAGTAAVKQSSETTASACDCSSLDQLDTELEVDHTLETSKSTKMSSELNKGKHYTGNSEEAGRGEAEEVAKKHEPGIVSAPGSLAVSGHCRKNENDTDVDKKPALPLDPSLGELWQDPCIAFAIKTLTGISYEDCTSIEPLTVSNNSDCGGLTTFEDHGGKKDAGDGGDKNIVPLGNLAIPEAKTSSDKAGEKPGSSLGLPFADGWTDPCIEFAIKTLTGAIPLDYDMGIQDYPRQQVGIMTQGQGSSGLSLPNVGEFGQNEYLCQQYGSSSEKTLLNQAALVEPALTPTKTVSLGYSSVGNTTRSQRSSGGARSYRPQR